MSSSTSVIPPPPDEDISALSDRELLERLFREHASLRHDFKELRRRQKASDANMGLVINAVQALCLERGLHDHHGRLDVAAQRWAEEIRGDQGANGGVRSDEIPTSPENQKPEPPDFDA